MDIYMTGKHKQRDRAHSKLSTVDEPPSHPQLKTVVSHRVDNWNSKMTEPTIKHPKEPAISPSTALKEKRRQQLFKSHTQKLNIGKLQHQSSQPEFSGNSKNNPPSYRSLMNDFSRSLSLDDRVVHSHTLDHDGGPTELVSESQVEKGEIPNTDRRSKLTPPYRQRKPTPTPPGRDSTKKPTKEDKCDEPPLIFVYPDVAVDRKEAATSTIPSISFIDAAVDTNRLLDAPTDNKRRPRSPSFGKRLRKLTHAATHKTESLLQAAVLDSDCEALEKLFSGNNVNVNYLYPPGVSLLHQACIIGDFFVVKLLVEKGADVLLKTWSGYTSLQLAAIRGNFDVAQWLLLAGADVDDVVNGHYPERLCEMQEVTTKAFR